MTFQTIKVPTLGQVGGGRPVEQLDIKGYRIIRSVPGIKREDIAAIQVVGDSLQEDNIVDGDWIIFKYTYEAREGQLVIALTPDGLTAKYYFPLENGVLLKAAHPAYDQFWEANEVIIQGVALRMERDI